MVTNEITEPMLTPPQTVERLLIHLHRLQVKVWVDNGRLYSQDPAGLISPALRAEIQRCKAEMITFLEAAQSDSVFASDRPAAIPLADREQPLPLSFAQHRLWFLDQLEGGANLTYIIPAAYRLSGQLQMDLLERALNAIVQRHEALRTNFQSVKGEPTQQIHSTRTLPLAAINLSHLPIGTQEEELEQRLLAEAARPFDLASGSLIRATLYVLSPTEHVLHLTMHHIIADGWSLERLLSELDVIYTAFLKGEESPLLPLKVQCADYALWQRRWLQTGKSEKRSVIQSAYWRRYLADVPTVLELPTDHPRPAVQSFRGASERFEFSADLTARLREFCRQRDITLFIALFGAFAVQLARYSGQDDVVIGTPVANRNHPDMEALIGFFVNTLPLRVQCRDGEAQPLSFATLLNQIRGSVLGAFAHQDIPFDQLIQELDIRRDLSHTPLVQVIFALENRSARQYALAELSVEPLSLNSHIAKFDLSMVLEEDPTTLSGLLEYNTDLFCAATIRRMIGHFETLLAGMIADPILPVHKYPLLTAAERQEILVDWAQTAVDSPAVDHSANKCVHQLFEAQAALTPDAVALVVDEDQQSVSYADLNARANQLAHHLRSLGVGSEMLVGLCVDRSIEMIVGLLGILKSGGAYLPLDPLYPADRLAFMLHDATPILVVSQTQQRHLFPDGAQLVLLDEEASRIARQSTQNPATTVQSANLAYVIYTSGSTGQPKGALLQHDGLVNAAAECARRFGLTIGDRVLQFSSLNFDAATFEIFLALGVGAALYLGTRESLAPGEPLQQFLARNSISCVTLTPSTLAAIPVSELAALHTVIVAGEVCPAELIDKWIGSHHIYNLYGPTEATIWTTFHRCAAGMKTPPIGRPIANVRVYLLDPGLNPVPVGVPGELHIGGVSVGRGYYNRPALTAERFISNPFGEGRLYKTGDLARWRPDGAIEFVGRGDYQVKIRGFRIELGEIEAALTSHPAVQETVVVAHSGTAGEKRVVAYVVPRPESQSLVAGLQSADLRAYIQKKLPGYMAPAGFVVLDALPLTANGKVDRKALPTLDFRADDDVYVAPRTPMEAEVAAIWAEVLGLSKVGATDNFFDLGGHSLLVTQILARVRKRFQVELPVRALFEAATVSGLSRRIEVARTGSQMQGVLSAVQSVDRTQILPLSFAQERLWFLAQLEGASASYHIPVALRLQGTLNVAALQNAIHAVVQRHESLRTTFVATSDADKGETAVLATQQIHPTMTVPLQIINRRPLSWDESQQRHELQSMLAQAADAPFDLTQGPLLRVHLYELDDIDHLLLVTMHHIVSDGWSFDIWWRELSAFYQAAVTGAPAKLEPLPFQYADFALWQRQWLAAPGVRETHLAYWREQLAGVPPLLELPTDHPRPARQTYHGETEWFEIAPDLVAGLRTLSKAANASLFMTLLGSFALLLARYSQQTDLVVGTPIASRGQPEIEGLIGLFVNTLPLRINLASKATFLDLLAQVRKVSLDGHAHQDLPFEQLVNELDIPRSLSYAPLFQVMVTHYKARRTGASFGTLTTTPVVVDNVTAKFDLTLYLEEEANSTGTGEGLRCAIEYNSDLFNAPSILRMIGHWRRMLQGIVSAPATTIHDLPVLTEGEVNQLDAWNQTSQPYSADQCIHELFEAQVFRTPDAVALVADCGSMESLTYREVNQRANQLAHYLIENGAKPGHFVGLCVPQSAQLIVALLGILKTGAAYVPLDGGLPVERLAQMTCGARMQMVVTTEVLGSLLPASLKRVYLDGEVSAQIAQALITNPMGQADPGALIYMIYTSGSTGVPKGAGVYHHSFVNLVQWFVTAFEIGQTDRVLITSSISFDLTQKNFFAPLIVGGQLHLSREAPYEYAAMRRHIVRHAISWLNCAPSAFYPFVDSLDSPLEKEARFAALRSLRYVFLGGEPIAVTRLQGWLNSSQCRATLVNTYGPTECTDVVAAYRLDSAQFPDLTEIPLGVPIQNVSLHVMDKQGRTVPVGVPGELWIGGVCVGAGYLDDPALSAAKFVENQEPSGSLRLYRTGDLVIRQPDGLLVFLGRIDDQVKVRGFRIELGEIEAVLSRHPTVQQAVVIAVSEEGQATRLVAYVELKPKAVDGVHTGNAHSLRSPELDGYLRLHLPDYMLPTALVVLAQFPLTASGKIDRKLLPPVDPERLVGGFSDTRFEAPVGEAEEELAGLWTGLLCLESIGRHDNFFALGGHSLLAVQLVARIRARFGPELPVRAIFEAPTLAKLAQVIAGASQQDEQITHIPFIPKLPRLSEHTDLSLSFAQQRFWFLQRLDNAGNAYNIPTAFHIKGALQITALERALAAMLQRHEVLRTTFPTVDGVPVQRIHASLPFVLEQVDLQESDLAFGKESWMAQVRRDAAHRFDFDRGPLLRVTLYRLLSDTTVLLVNIHHIIADDWSIDVWWQDLNVIYQEYVSGQAAVLPLLSIQYADFAQWQRARLTGEVLANQLAYWQLQLAAAPILLELPTDRPRPPVFSYKGALERFVLPAALVSTLFQRCQELAVTPFMLLHAAFALLLARYSEQDDVVIGIPISNRQHIEIERLIGFFGNTLALRTDLTGNPPFTTLLAQVRQTVLDGFAHAEVPFERLVSDLNIPRNLNHAPLFQVLFVWQQALAAEPALGDLVLTPLPIEPTTAKFDLTLFLTEELAPMTIVKGVAGAFEYSTDLFDRATIQRMIEHLTVLLTAIVADPQMPIRRLPLVPVHEEATLLYTWNATQSPEPIHQCLHHLCESQVARTPDSVAVVLGDRSLTYRQLNSQANQLAHYLQEIGVGPDVVVGLCMERSIDLMVGLLGILKAGGAYLPVDASYPADRIAYMLTNAGVPLLLTQCNLLDRLPATATKMVCLEKIWPILDRNFAAPAQLENLGTPLTVENLLYVLYTSGSTGQPKGVAMPHRPLVNLIQWHLQQPHSVPPDDYEPARTLQFSPISFDVSCQEVFATWCSGGTLVLVDETTRRDPYALLHYLIEKRIERLFLPFVALQQLAEAAAKQPNWMFALRDVITAGEQLRITPAIIAWFRRMSCTLHNHYGPTETHVVTSYTLPFVVDQWPHLPPIGRPIANNLIYILDKNSHPAPTGVTGELYLGGAGVALGYLNQPELTQERFLSNPWAEGKLYRSGDLGCYRTDGVIEYLGRADDQVKVLGYRIDPGEIESVLAQHPTVQEVAVVAPLNSEGHRRLVAYVVPKEPAHSRDLRAVWRQHLQGKLPTYMLPAQLVKLARFPLTPSGKVDRRKLLAPGAFVPLFESQSVSPQTDLEKAIALVWKDLLQIDTIGLHDNFFDVGGHSLLVVQLHDRMQQTLAVDLTITDLFQYSTVSTLATYLAKRSTSERSHQENELRAIARRNALRQVRVDR